MFSVCLSSDPRSVLDLLPKELIRLKLLLDQQTRSGTTSHRTPHDGHEHVSFFSIILSSPFPSICLSFVGLRYPSVAGNPAALCLPFLLSLSLFFSTSPSLSFARVLLCDSVIRFHQIPSQIPTHRDLHPCEVIELLMFYLSFLFDFEPFSFFPFGNLQ